MERRLTIGQLARRTGVSVKTLRFYSDEGLLPPIARSRSGYRLYGPSHVVRVELVVALRAAGVGLDEIGRLLRRDVTLDTVLRLRLGTVEAQINHMQRIAAALRLAIQAGATEEHLRRITMVTMDTRGSSESLRHVIAAFHEKAAEGIAAPRPWLDGMIDASLPSAIESPSPEQLAARAELEGLLDDPALLACKRANMADALTRRAPRTFNAFIDAQTAVAEAATAAIARGVAPSSKEAGTIVDRFVTAFASVTSADLAATRAHLTAKYDPRGARYWELCAILKGEPALCAFDDWRWIGDALRGPAA